MKRHVATAAILVLSFAPVLSTDADAKNPLVELVTACERLLLTNPTNYSSEFEPGLDVYAVIPKTEKEYHNVFGKTKVYTQAASADMTAAASAVNKQSSWRVADAATVTTAKAAAAQHLKDYIRSSKKSLVGIIGHNEDGQFKFVDGTSMSIEDIAETCFSLKKKCIIISCNSEKYISQSAQAAGAVAGTAERPLFAHVPSLIDGLNNFVLEKAAKNEKVSYKKVESAILATMKQKNVEPGLMQAVMPDYSSSSSATGAPTASAAPKTGSYVIVALTFGNQDEEEKRRRQRVREAMKNTRDALLELEKEAAAVPSASATAAPSSVPRTSTAQQTSPPPCR